MIFFYFFIETFSHARLQIKNIVYVDHHRLFEVIILCKRVVSYMEEKKERQTDKQSMTPFTYCTGITIFRDGPMFVAFVCNPFP